jgi:hypothetical protein
MWAQKGMPRIRMMIEPVAGDDCVFLGYAFWDANDVVGQRHVRVCFEGLITGGRWMI